MNESELFEYLKRYFPDLELADDQFSPYDCFSRFFKTIIELKCRRTHYDELILERKKYESLIKYKERASILYINSTPSGVYMFDLEEIIPVWHTRKLPKQTDFTQTHDIDKEYTLLQTASAQKI